jgi:hypothetical protein
VAPLFANTGPGYWAVADKPIVLSKHAQDVVEQSPEEAALGLDCLLPRASRGRRRFSLFALGLSGCYCSLFPRCYCWLFLAVVSRPFLPNK